MLSAFQSSVYDAELEYAWGAAYIQKRERINGGQFEAIQYGFTDNEDSVTVSIRNFRTWIHDDQPTLGR